MKSYTGDFIWSAVEHGRLKKSFMKRKNLK